MIISREVDINVNRYGLRVVIPVVQYDSGRQIIFNIVDAELPSGCTSNIFIKKPSGKSVYNSCTVSGNKVTVTLTNQSLSEYGFNDAQIQIIKGEEVVTSFGFILEVKQSDADNAVISKSESTFFQGIVNKAQAAATTAEKVLDSIPDDYSQMSTKVNTNTTAIATLNSSLATLKNSEWRKNVDFNTLTSDGIYYVSTGGQNMPSGVSSGIWSPVRVYSRGDTVRQIIYGQLYVYERIFQAGAWGEWVKQATRAEIDALNNNLIYGGFGVNQAKPYKLIEHNATLADFTNPGWYRLGGNDFDDTIKSAVDSTTFPMTQKDYYIQVIGTDFNNGIRYGILNVYTPRHDFFVTGRIWNGSVYHWEKAPLRSEFDALNNNLGSLRTSITANANAIANVKTDLLGGYKLVGYTASVALNKAGEFIIPYPSGESFGTVYGILSATFLQGGYCLPNPPLTPSSTSPAYDISAAVAFRLLSTGIAIYTGGAWGADSRDIYFVLICKA